MRQRSPLARLRCIARCLAVAACLVPLVGTPPAYAFFVLGTDSRLQLSSALTPQEMFRWHAVPTQAGEKVIHYRLDPHFTPAQAAAVTAAFDTWNQRRTAQPNTTPGNWGNGDLESIALHEIGHALGLAHAGIREERDRFGRPLNRFWDTDPNPLANNPFNQMVNPDRTNLRESANRPIKENFQALFPNQGLSSAVMTYDVLGPNMGQTRRRLEFDDLGGLAFAGAGRDNRAGTGDDFSYRFVQDPANPNGVERDLLRGPGGQLLPGADEATARGQARGGAIDVFAFNPFFFNPRNPQAGSGVADMVYDRLGVGGAGRFTIHGGDIYLHIPGQGPVATTFQGTFDATLPGCTVPPHVCNGLGTASFNTGTPGRTPFNIGFDFFPASYPVEPAGIFSVGMLTVRNGETFLGSTPAFPGTNTFLLDLHVRELTNGILGAEGDVFLAYYSSPDRFPDLRHPGNADILYNPLHPQAGGLWILEGNTIAEAVANVSLLMRRGSLEFAGFFADFEFVDLEQNGFFAPLPKGRIDPGTGFFFIVPEPGSLLLVLSGLAGIAALVRRGKDDRKGGKGIA